jgi:hypothetical protein
MFGKPEAISKVDSGLVAGIIILVIGSIGLIWGGFLYKKNKGAHMAESSSIKSPTGADAFDDSEL